jgi:NAD(P)-dependent dehydrogenase (short-subunit alcohol dehydrogenase family)
MEELSGKAALVTGSTDGVGRLVARKLGQAGACVLVHGRNAERGARVIARIEDQRRGDFERVWMQFV